MKGESSLISFSASTSNEDLINKEVGVISRRWAPDARTSLFVDTEHLAFKTLPLIYTHICIIRHKLSLPLYISAFIDTLLNAISVSPSIFMEHIKNYTYFIY